MEKNRAIPSWVTIVLLVLSAGAIVWNVISLFNFKNLEVSPGVFGYISTIALAVAGIGSIVYIGTGHQKKFAAFYFLFLIGFLVSSMASFVTMVTNELLHQLIIPYGIFSVCLLIMIFVKNLGKDISYVIVGVLLITAIAVLILSIIIFYKELGVFRLNSTEATGLIYAIVLMILVFAKFKDKIARGRWVDEE